MLSLNVSTESLVCRPCRDDITRVLANPAYIPRWKKGEVEICNRYCCVKNCNSISFTQTNMCSSSNELKCIDGIEFTTECIPIPTPLCKNHYHVVYDALQSRRKHCITCGRRLHPGSDRRCPQPHIIQMHLTQHTDFEGSILRDDRVCLTCYKSHLVILKENRPVSTDEDLKVLIDTLGVQTGAINSSTQDIIFAATTRMLTIVGKMLMENRAMLLPTIQSDFIKGARDLIAAKGMQEPQELKSLSSRCILSEITAKYQHHVTFLRYFFHFLYASFISGANSQGSLSDIEFQDDYKKGFLAFLRLVGTVYFKKHASGFDTPSPPTHFLQFAHADPSVQHKQWINDIRQNIADRTTFDTNMVPSTDALYLHWKRACWVLSMWGQADRNTMVLEPITENGWRLECTNLCVVWDMEENMQTVRERVCLLLKGCKCVTGCKNRVCGCKKKQSKCTEGCQCINCENQDSQEGESDELASVALEEELHSSGNVHLNEDEEDEFAEFVFAASCDTESETNIHID